MGVLIFVMLCLGFPSKDAGESSHRSHKLWPTLSGHAQFLIDGLLNVDPSKRLGILDLYNHPWVALAQVDDNDESFQRSISKQSVLDKAEVELGTTKRAPEPRWNTGDQTQWHVQLTEKRISVAKALLDERVHSRRRLKP